MNQQVSDKSKATTVAKKPTSMAAMFQSKGSASPAADVNQGGAGVTVAPAAVAEPVVVATAATATSEVPATTLAIPGESSAADLSALIASLTVTSPAVTEGPVQKQTLNLKLTTEIVGKLKRIVGAEQYRRMNNFSQQDYLESRLVAIINFEYDRLPKM